MKKKSDLIYNRARTRALTLLAHDYPKSFAKILADEIRVATIEAAMMLRPDGEPERLRPGPRKPDDKATDRIDVAYCPVCAEYHDNGHACPFCGWSTEDDDVEPGRPVVDAVEMLP